MSAQKYSAGLHNVGSYQVSGMPFCSSSLDATDANALIIEFPYVTQWVQIINHDNAVLSASFTPEGMTGSNCIVFHAHNPSDHGGYEPTIQVKCTRMYFTGSGNFNVVAGLTGIPIERINAQSPSGSKVNFYGLYDGV